MTMAEAASIPVIDISSPNQSKVAKELVEAAVEHGFIYIKNTGGEVPVDQIEDIFNTVGLRYPSALGSKNSTLMRIENTQTRTLFALPVEEKAPCKITTSNAGWVGMHTETLDPKHQRVRCLPIFISV